MNCNITKHTVPVCRFPNTFLINFPRCHFTCQQGSATLSSLSIRSKFWMKFPISSPVRQAMPLLEYVSWSCSRRKSHNFSPVMSSQMFSCGMSLNSLCLGTCCLFFKAFASMVHVMTTQIAEVIHPDFTYLFNTQIYTYLISTDTNLVSSTQLNKLCENSIPKSLV